MPSMVQDWQPYRIVTFSFTHHLPADPVSLLGTMSSLQAGNK